MSAIDASILLQGVGRAQPAGARVLRVVLCAGEVLCLPRRRLDVRVLSGAAWVTFAGRDVVLAAGARMELPRARRANGCTVISSLGAEALLLETRRA